MTFTKAGFAPETRTHFPAQAGEAERVKIQQSMERKSGFVEVGKYYTG